MNMGATSAKRKKNVHEKEAVRVIWIVSFPDQTQHFDAYLRLATTFTEAVEVIPISLSAKQVYVPWSSSSARLTVNSSPTGKLFTVDSNPLPRDAWTGISHCITIHTEEAVFIHILAERTDMLN